MIPGTVEFEEHYPGFRADAVRTVEINGRWPVTMPEHRAARPEWPWWEAQRLAAMHSLVANLRRPDRLTDDPVRPVVYDVGAEEGDFPALYSTWGCDVFAIEPNPKAWPWIRRTWNANHQRTSGAPFGREVPEFPMAWASVLLGAAQSWPTETYADVGPVGQWWGAQGWPDVSFREDAVPDHGFFHLAEHRTVCPVVTLDQLTADCAEMLPGFRPPDIIAMDCEGGEFQVVLGAQRVLEEFRPWLLISVHPEFMRDLYDENEQDLHDFLRAVGYIPTFLAADHEHHWIYEPPTE